MTHYIKDMKTGNVVSSKAKTRNGLQRYADKLNLAYGAHRYSVFMVLHTASHVQAMK